MIRFYWIRYLVNNYGNYDNFRFEVPHLQIFENTSILMTVGEIRGNPPVIGNLPENSNHSNEAYVSWRWKTRIFKSCISIFQSCENLPICFDIFCTNYENNGKGQGLKNPNRGESPQFFGVGTHICPLCQKWLPTEKHSHAHKLWMNAQSLVILFSERAWKIINLWKPTQTMNITHINLCFVCNEMGRKYNKTTKRKKTINGCSSTCFVEWKRIL